MVEQHKKLLERQLWNIANDLRGNMTADEFRDYILGFIFYKYLSERIQIFADKLLATEKTTYTALDAKNNQEHQAYIAAIKEEATKTLGYFLTPDELFESLTEQGGEGQFIIEPLTDVLKHIEQSTMGTESEDDFEGLFSDIDLTSNKLGKSEKAKNELISKIFSHLNDIDFLHDETEIDVLGDAYEYLIGQFASGAGKKAGEFYTPPMVSKLLAKLVTQGKSKLKSVYDPTCGSGSLLLRVSKEVDEVGQYYGQESNPSTYNLARMNMILHGVHYSEFDIKQEDTLEHPQHTDLQFEAVVANPPFSAKWSAAAGFLTDERFSDYGKLAPASKADFAFVQHMVHQLDENGTMAVVLPHGVLFRGAAEGHIRKHLIKDKNYLDVVIGLPANIFYGTSIPTCILLLKKNRQHQDNILFIDASQNFDKATNQNYLREQDLAAILEAITERSNLAPAKADKFAYVASLTEIEQDNDFNLNIPRYVDTFEEEKAEDLDEVVKQLLLNKTQLDNINSFLDEQCAELNLPKIGDF